VELSVVGLASWQLEAASQSAVPTTSRTRARPSLRLCCSLLAWRTEAKHCDHARTHTRSHANREWR
jgi:hypothetical protein